MRGPTPTTHTHTHTEAEDILQDCRNVFSFLSRKSIFLLLVACLCLSWGCRYYRILISLVLNKSDWGLKSLLSVFLVMWLQVGSVTLPQFLPSKTGNYGECWLKSTWFKLESLWSREPLLWKYLYLWASLRCIFLIGYGWCGKHQLSEDSAIPGLAVWCAVRRQAEQVMRSKPVSGASFSLVLQFLSLGFCPAWVHVLTFWSDELSVAK